MCEWWRVCGSTLRGLSAAREKGSANGIYRLFNWISRTSRKVQSESRLRSTIKFLLFSSCTWHNRPKIWRWVCVCAHCPFSALRNLFFSHSHGQVDDVVSPIGKQMLIIIIWVSNNLSSRLGQSHESRYMEKTSATIAHVDRRSTDVKSPEKYFSFRFFLAHRPATSNNNNMWALLFWYAACAPLPALCAWLFTYVFRTVKTEKEEGTSIGIIRKEGKLLFSAVMSSAGDCEIRRVQFIAVASTSTRG